MRQTIGRPPRSARALPWSLRTQLLPATATALLVRISVATADQRYDLRALASALGLMVILVFALAVATVGALATHAAIRARRLAAEVRRTRVRFGPGRSRLMVLPPPISDGQLQDKRGRPLRGAARAARTAALERERARLIQAARAVPVERVITLPALPRVDVRFPRLSVRAVRALAITTTMTFVFATILGTTGVITRQGTVAFGASTTLTIIRGEVEVQAAPSDGFRSVDDGTLLRAGMTIRTGAEAFAVLTYFEGSTVSLDPGTTLIIEALNANPDGSTVIAMRQQLGHTWHAVAKLLHPGSRYEVRTPSATAQVRGTMFAVGIDTDDQGEVVTTVETTEGAVATAKAPTPQEPQPTEEVLVRPGDQVTVKASAPLEQPKPAPEPDRKVTVTVGTPSGLILDPMGRANGIKDGKVVVQTPGATVKTVEGKLVVTLPNVADGKIATVLDQRDPAREPVEVVTTVTEKGRSDQHTTERAQAASVSSPAVSAVDVKKGEATEVAVVTDQQKKDIAASVKVADAPKTGVEEHRGDPKPSDTEKASAKEAVRSDQKGGAQKGGAPGGPAGGGAGFVPILALPAIPGGLADQGAARQAVRREQGDDGSKGDDPKADARTGEAPRAEAARAEAPRIEAPKRDEPKRDETKRDEAPSIEAPKRDEPKREEPKAAAPNSGDAKAPAPAPDLTRPEAKKDEQKKPETREESRGFVPRLELPSIPIMSETPKKEEPKRPVEEQKPAPKAPAAPRIDLPRVELPRIELPVFQRAPETKGVEPAPARIGNDDKDNEKGKEKKNSKNRD